MGCTEHSAAAAMEFKGRGITPEIEIWLMLFGRLFPAFFRSKNVTAFKKACQMNEIGDTATHKVRYLGSNWSAPQIDLTGI
jgi:hypothetical protein